MIFLISQNVLPDLKRPKEKYNLYYGWLLGPPYDTTLAAVIANNIYNYDPSRVVNILMRKGMDI